MKLSFRIRSGKGKGQRFTPIFSSLSHLMESDIQQHIAFVKGSPGPYFLEISYNGWRDWEEVGQLDG